MKRRTLAILLLVLMVLVFFAVDAAMIAISSRTVTVSSPPADAAQSRVVPKGNTR